MKIMNNTKKSKKSSSTGDRKVEEEKKNLAIQLANAMTNQIVVLEESDAANN